MLATRSQFARRSLGVLRQHLEHHAQLIEHVLIRHHWVLEFLKTRNSKLDTGDISPLLGLKTCSRRFLDYGFKVLAGSMDTVGLDPLDHAGRPIYCVKREALPGAAQCCDSWRSFQGQARSAARAI